MKPFLIIAAALILTLIVWLSINARWVARQILAGSWRGRHSDGREVVLEIDDNEQENKAGTFMRVIRDIDHRVCESGRWTRNLCEFKLHIEKRDGQEVDELEDLYLFWETSDNVGLMDDRKQRTDLNRTSDSLHGDFQGMMPDASEDSSAADS
jgi:hypothetical protein